MPDAATAAVEAHARRLRQRYPAWDEFKVQLRAEQFVRAGVPAPVFAPEPPTTEISLATLLKLVFALRRFVMLSSLVGPQWVAVALAVVALLSAVAGLDATPASLDFYLNAVTVAIAGLFGAGAAVAARSAARVKQPDEQEK